MKVNGYWLLCLGLIGLFGCYPDESLDVEQNEPDIELTELDEYIQTNFTDKYDMAIRYRFVDRYVDPGQRVTPPRIEIVRPMLDFIQTFWIDPYLMVDNGETFFKNHVPPEIVLLGGPIYNSDGTVTLGTADAGAQITFTDVNALDTTDLEWQTLQLRVVYHEFAHTVHQRYKLPTAYETISPAGYTSSGSWFVLTDDEALKRGFPSPYGTSSPNEDFAEMVAFFLFDTDFYTKYIDRETDCLDTDCEERNAGRVMIEGKLAAVADHYEQVTGIDLEELRAIIQSQL